MSAFGDAFKAARAAGKKTFTFNGKSYHTRTKEDEGKAKPAAKPDVSKATAGPAVYEKKKAPPMDDATKARVKRNTLEQKAMRGEDMSKDTKTPSKPASAKAPEMPKADKKDDTSLSLSERMKRTKERARTSNTGTDTRSVSQRIKEAIGMRNGGSVKAAKKGSKARGGGAATRGTKFSGVF